MRLFALLAALLLAGCLSIPSETAQPSPTPGERTASTGPCQDGEEALLVWSSDGAANPTEETFDVKAGTNELWLEWTPPATSARGYSAVVTGPEGEEIFVERHGEGATAGGTGVSLTDRSSSTSKHLTPDVGSYSFTYSTPGQVQGAALHVVAKGCW